MFEEQCEQICTNQATSYECKCVPGYRLVDSQQCIANNDPPSRPLLAAFTDQHSISVNLLNGTSITRIKVEDEEEEIVAFDFDYSNQTICYLKKRHSFTENLRSLESLKGEANISWNRINCFTFNNGGQHSWSYSINSSYYDSIFVRQLVFESLGHNWYLLDPVQEQIFACNQTFTACIGIVDSGLNKPKSIALDSNKGYLFFVEWGPTALLGRFQLDGSNRINLAQERIVYPNSVSLDLANQYVYWSDSYLDTLERIDYSGKKRRTILKNSATNRIISFDLIERKLYFLFQIENSSYSSLQVADIFNRHSLQTTLANESTAQTIRLVHRQRQPKQQQHPCSANNGGCEHLCITGYDHKWNPMAQCRCMPGYYMQHSTCVTTDHLPQLIYIRGRPGSLKLIALEERNDQDGAYIASTNQIMISTVPLTRPVAVDYDRISRTVFFSDIQRYVINHHRIDSASEHRYAAVFLDKGVIRCEGIAVDWLDRNLYWTDSALLAISVASVANSTVRKHLITTELNHPKSIVLLQEKGFVWQTKFLQSDFDLFRLMYWTDWTFHSNTSGKIESAWMDGSNRRVVIQDKLNYPNGLTVESSGEHIYWCDAYFKQLERANLDGSNRKVWWENLFRVFLVF